MTEPLFDKVAIIGLGLIGSSMARGIKKRGLAATVIGYDGSPDVRTRARDLGFCDAICGDRRRGRDRDASLVVLAVPVGAMGAAAQSIASHLAEGAIVTDVGSVKTAVVRQVGEVLPDQAVFVPGHPVAGTEYSGPEAGFAELFEGRWFVVTPCERSTAEGVEAVSSLWRGLGSTVEQMTPEHHDIVLAMTSHVPHLIAYNIVGTAAELGDRHSIGSHQVFGRRLPRFHAHSLLRPGDVAGRLSEQQGGGLGSSWPLFRGPRSAAAHGSLGRRTGLARPLHPRSGGPA